MDRSVEPSISFAVPDQFSVLLFVEHLQLLNDAFITLTSKKECPAGVLSEIGVIMKRRQLIIDRHAPDTRADIMGSVINIA